MSEQQAIADTSAAEHAVDNQARQQTGRPQVEISIDEKAKKTSYANAFRSNGTAEEVVLDFGLNITGPASSSQFSARVLFEVEERVIMNYFTAKRLAMVLAQIVRRHEDQFGEIQLDAAQRSRKK